MVGIHFIRKNGRIIPVRDKDGSKQRAASATVGMAGAAAAADAARTKRVFVDKAKGFAIDRKRFQIPITKNPIFGDGLHLSVKGKHAGSLFYHHDKTEKGLAGVTWLVTKKPFRGQGLSKVLAKQGAIEMRAKGGTHMFDHVVHPNSASLGTRQARTTYWKEGKAFSDGTSIMHHIDKKEALKLAGQYRKGTEEISKMGPVARAIRGIKGAKGKNKGGPAAVFRETRLPRMAREIKPFRTGMNKLTIAAGLGVAALGAAGYFSARKKKESK